MDVLKTVESQNALLLIVSTAHSSSRFLRRLNGRKQHSDQNANNRYDDQQLNQRKSESTFHNS